MESLAFFIFEEMLKIFIQNPCFKGKLVVVAITETVEKFTHIFTAAHFSEFFKIFQIVLSTMIAEKFQLNCIVYIKDTYTNLNKLFTKKTNYNFKVQ